MRPTMATMWIQLDGGWDFSDVTNLKLEDKEEVTCPIETYMRHH